MDVCIHRKVAFAKKQKQKCVWIFLFLALVLLIWTHLIGLWKIELEYDYSRYNTRSSGLSFNNFPRLVLKTRRFRSDPGDPSPQDLVSLMRDVNVKSYSEVKMPSCNQLFQGNLTAVKEGIIYEKIHTQPKIPDRSFVHLTKNCEGFIQKQKYITHPVSNEEADFPLAYSVLVYDDAEQFEKLLHAIYRPQNYYCIHIDRKSKGSFHSAVRAITECFNNVFIASNLFDVQWGTYSVLQPELVCMKDLWKYPKWKYFINLTGKEYPLKTNLDLVKILKVFNGANNMEATIKEKNSERTAYVYHGHEKTSTRKSSAPVPVTLTKGSVHVTVSRAFVDYILHDQRALLFRDWINDTGIPDETFFSSLGHSPQMDVPGAYAGEPETDPKTYPFFTRFKNWGSWPFNYPCYGMRLRRICLFGVGDLQLLVTRPEFFANKFHLSFQPKTLQCLEEWLNERVAGDIAGTRHFNASAYGKYDFVWNRV